METAKIRHYNRIQTHINDALENDFPEGSRGVYCKKLHKVTEPETSDCSNCEYYGGLMGGWGHECVWEDEQLREEEHERVIPWVNRHKELLRVSKLIDDGIIAKN